jgi:acyl-CoA reductase-like NAD-dependent aldehyde dehydrogenase
VTAAIDRLVYYAGWADKYQQVFSTVNPVSTSHFNFSMLEPTGVVAIIAPEASGLLGLVSNVAPAVVINVLTGLKEELIEQFASHMDVNAVLCNDADAAAARKIQELAADNIKRVTRSGADPHQRTRRFLRPRKTRPVRYSG